MSRSEDVYRLEEIVLEIKQLVEEANHIFRRYPGEVERFRSYPYADIVGALDNEHGFLGGSMITFEECIECLREDEGADE